MEVFDMFDHFTGGMIPLLMKKMSISEGDDMLVVVIKNRLSNETEVRSMLLTSVFQPAAIKTIVDTLRYEDAECVVLYAFTKDREIGTRALETVAANIVPFNIKDAVWTDTHLHGHWGARGSVHENPKEE